MVRYEKLGKTEPVVFEFPSDMKPKLRKFAANQGYLSVSDCVRTLIRREMEKAEKMEAGA